MYTVADLGSYADAVSMKASLQHAIGTEVLMNKRVFLSSAPTNY